MNEIQKAILLLVENGYAVYRVPRKSDERKPNIDPQANPSANHGALTITQFCAAYKVSRTHFYELVKNGKGPALMKVGRQTLIGFDAATEWATRMQVSGISAAASRTARVRRAGAEDADGGDADFYACVATAYRNGHTQRQIVDATGASIYRVREALRRAGLIRHNRSRKQAGG